MSEAVNIAVAIFQLNHGVADDAARCVFNPGDTIMLQCHPTLYRRILNFNPSAGGDKQTNEGAANSAILFSNGINRTTPDEERGSL